MIHSRRFGPEVSSVPAARRFAGELLRGGSPAAREAVMLMVSELATNCVRHGEAGFQVAISREPGEALVEVTDRSRDLPMPREAAPDDPGGRGMGIVAALADHWGVRRTREGKTVWLTVELEREFPRDAAGAEP